MNVTHGVVHRCLFCRMPTTIRFLGLHLCPICRDQFYDFLWASAVNVSVTVPAGLSGRWFVVEEGLLFAVLVLVRHRFPPPWQREQ